MAGIGQLDDAAALVRASGRARTPTWFQQVVDPLSSIVDDAAGRVRAQWPGRTTTSLVSEAARTRAARLDLPANLPGGRLPVGIHDADLASFLLRFGTDRHRAHLLASFAEEALRLQRAGVREVYVGGSVLDLSRRPGDIDALVHAADADALGVLGRARSWLRGTHWHVAERRHATTDPLWGGQRPTWLEYFGRDRAGDEQAVVRVLLS